MSATEWLIAGVVIFMILVWVFSEPKYPMGVGERPKTSKPIPAKGYIK
jgi:hypothetical protein